RLSDMGFGHPEHAALQQTRHAPHKRRTTHDAEAGFLAEGAEDALELNLLQPHGFASKPCSDEVRNLLPLRFSGLGAGCEGEAGAIADDVDAVVRREMVMLGQLKAAERIFSAGDGLYDRTRLDPCCPYGNVRLDNGRV